MIVSHHLHPKKCPFDKNLRVAAPAQIVTFRRELREHEDSDRGWNFALGSRVVRETPSREHIMPTSNELEAKLWKALRSDMTVMLGLERAGDNLMRPMTVQIDGDADHGPLWIFSAKDTELVKALAGSNIAFMSFADKGHDLFAKINGTITLDNDRTVIERLWNRFVAAWYEQGKDDPKLALLRFDPHQAEIWENEWTLIAGIKLLFGSDPTSDYADKTANVRLD